MQSGSRRSVFVSHPYFYYADAFRVAGAAASQGAAGLARTPPPQPSAATSSKLPATNELGELKLDILPYDQSTIDTGHHTNITILRDDKSHTSGKFGTISHHRSMASSVMLIIHLFQ